MKFYRVVYSSDYFGGGDKLRWFTVKRDAERFYNGKQRECLAPDFDGEPPGPVERVDVPTDKRGLTAFLNAWADTL